MFGSKLVSSSPNLIAAVHVLLRLSMPRHPPYALSSLTIPLRHSHTSSPSLSRRLHRVTSCPYSRAVLESRTPDDNTLLLVRLVVSVRSAGPIGSIQYTIRCLSLFLFICQRTSEKLSRASRNLWETLWSQSGSNRRPQACKARALPAEL